jgi:hypothetical protein
LEAGNIARTLLYLSPLFHAWKLRSTDTEYEGGRSKVANRLLEAAHTPSGYEGSGCGGGEFITIKI